MLGRHVLVSGLVLLFGFMSCSGLRQSTDGIRLFENPASIWVESAAPIPDDLANKVQAQALARNAAIALGQAKILNYILMKKTKSGKELSEAQIPSLQLQGEIKGIVQGAVVKSTTWKDGRCRVILVMSKRNLKRVLKEN